MRVLLLAILIVLFSPPSPAAEKKSPANTPGRYKISEAAGQTFLIDSATGLTWRWVWYESDSAECKKKKLAGGGNIASDCMVWQWARAVWLSPPSYP